MKEEEQALRHPRIGSVNNFIFLAEAPTLSLNVSC